VSTQVCGAVSIPVVEVDAHNVVPVWIASDKREYGAHTIRPWTNCLQSLHIPPVSLLKHTMSPASLLCHPPRPPRYPPPSHTQVCGAVSIPVVEVDAHNVVPVWIASDKREYGARTIRRKIQDKLPEFLCEYPQLPRPAAWGAGLPQPPAVDWEVRVFWRVCLCVCVCVDTAFVGWW
jgi:deoxyribodipyrimidine photo-lyase